MIDNCLGVTANGLGNTGVGLLSTIVAKRAVIGMEAVSIIMGILRASSCRKLTYSEDVVENRKTWKDCDVSCFIA